MLNQNIPPKKIGDCESCTLTGISITLHNRIWYCDECWKKDSSIIEANERKAAQNKEAQEILKKAKEIDDQIDIKQDIWNASTVAAIELKQAIAKDDSIPADQKDYRYAKLTEERRDKLQAIIFEEEKALIAKKTEMRMWHAQTVETCARLSKEYRAEFKEVNINYDVKPPKTTKPPKDKTPKTKTAEKPFNLTEIKEAAAKYKVDTTIVRMTSMQFKVDANTAARHASNKLQKKECDCSICKKAS